MKSDSQKKVILFSFSLLIFCIIAIAICGIFAGFGGGTKLPTQSWSFQSKDAYDFSSDMKSRHYTTDYRFAGAESYAISIKASPKSSLTVKICRASDSSELEKYRIPKGTTTIIEFDSSTIWYLEFSGRGEFECTVAPVSEDLSTKRIAHRAILLSNVILQNPTRCDII